MFGETYGTATLADSLSRLAADVRRQLDDGVPRLEVARGDARCLMEGAIALWERLMAEVTDWPGDW